MAEQGPVPYKESTSFADVATAVVLSKARTKRRESQRKSPNSVRLEEQREEDILPEAVQQKLHAAAKLARSRAWTRRRQKSTLNETCTSVFSDEVADGDTVNGSREGTGCECNDQQETNVVSITIHNIDPPKAKVLLNKMVIRVSFLDEQSSGLLKKSSHHRAVVSFYETHRPAVDYILPVLTGPAQHVSDRKGHLTPSWEECLIFNDRPSLLFHGPNTLILFELLLMTTIPPSTDLPWTCLAWGFLRPSVAMRKKELAKKGAVNWSCWIQLYRPPNLWRRRGRTPQIADMLNCESPRPYSTSLHVSLATIDPSDLPQHALTRSLLPTLPEESQTRLDDLMQPFPTNRPSANFDLSTQTWSRLPGQPCALPNQLRATLLTGSGGCVAICFSPSGRLLAVVCHHLNTFIIRLYRVPGFSEVCSWTVGREIVYELCWDSNDEWIAATCGSGLCHLWKLNDPMASEVLLSHPAYVYCAVFVLDKVITGSFDGSLRLWSNHKLKQVLSVHKTRINTLSYDARASRVYSGDSSGAIGVWSIECAMNDGSDCAELQFVKLFQLSEFQNHSIQRLILHPTQRKLLIHSLHNPLMMIDLRVWSVTQQYHTSDHTASRPVGVTITPCGGIVMAGSSALPLLYAWDCSTGELIKSMMIPGLQGIPLTVSYHPYDHFTAVSSWSPQQHVIIMEGKT